MYLILSETSQSCGQVLRSRTGVIVSPDYDQDGFYDLNVDCLWIVEAPEGHVIGFNLHFVNIEPTLHCEKDFLLVCITIMTSVGCVGMGGAAVTDG